MFPSGNRVYLYMHAKLHLGHKIIEMLRLEKSFKIIKPNLRPKKPTIFWVTQKIQKFKSCSTSCKLDHLIQTTVPG